MIRSRATLVGTMVIAASALLALRESNAEGPKRLARTLDDYRHFRITSIDLLGRMPTRDEVATFENPSFKEGAWVDSELHGPGYTARMTRIYMDLLRLEPNVNFSSGPTQLFRQEVEGPDGEPVRVFYRAGQRREREATDGDFCLSPEETGLVIRPNAQPLGTAKKVSKALLDKYTTVVKPWWLYKDYLSQAPTVRLGSASPDGGSDYRLADGLMLEPDNTSTTTEVRVCREEAATAQVGHIFASGRLKASADGVKPLPGGRLKPAPVDRSFATKHRGEPVSCDTKTALEYSVDCGCGIGLERCMPNDAPNQGSAFFFPNHMPLGPDLPLASVKQRADRWFPHWWSREAVRFLDDLFESDRDFREILTGHQTFINGPLAQFYKTVQRGNCCGPEVGFGMTEETEPLFEPARVPKDLSPEDVAKWERVDDRGPHASGILTMPMFLEKYASARARGAVLYNAFLCKSFIADQKTELTPSAEPNLMVRDGCSTCHATLEPLAAYFARVEPGNFVYLPASLFPVRNTTCKKDKNGKLNGQCNSLYDVAFGDATGSLLRGAYGSPAHAELGPGGAAKDITASPDFAKCAVERVAASFLGRPTTPDDEPLLLSLDQTFVRSGYRMRALVRALVQSREYQNANNVTSDVWRNGAGADGGSK